MNHKQKTIKELADAINANGFTVWLSYNKEYGFYTDDSNDRLISFQTEYFSARFSGNYNSRHCGQGWGLGDVDWSKLKSKTESKQYLTDLLNSNPPNWATNGENVTLKTVADNLRLYGDSSKFEIYKGERVKQPKNEFNDCK